MDTSSLKIALVADWITDIGGAENVFLKLMEMFPHADIYTSVFFQQNHPAFSGRTVYTSFLQHIPVLNRRHKLSMLLRPIAFESFDFSSYDLVISSASAEAKGIITNIDTLHICYCHTPTRYLWSHADAYKKYLEFGWLNPIAKLAMKLTFPSMKRWDQAASLRPDIYIANSETTATRIQDFYEHTSHVIYPFFQKRMSDNTQVQEKKDYYFAIGRCIPYKKFDLLVDTFNANGKRLKIATSTPTKLYHELRKKSKPNIEWIFEADNEQVADLFAHARAYIMPQEEDFGITPIESMSYGTPVIAYEKGGATETVIAGKTGLFFASQSPESLQKAIEQFEKQTFNPTDCIDRAEVFSEEVFEGKMRALIDSISDQSFLK